MNPYVKSYYEKLQYYEELIMEDLANLVAVRSVYDEKSAGPSAPFGSGVRQAFDQMIRIMERDGFFHEDFGGYALHSELGTGEEIVGILAHLDIVPEGNIEDWTFDPFTLTDHDGHLYGRGVNDDKAPLLAAYYAMKILRDLQIPLKRKIRLIVGGAEETTWECMDHYFRYNPQPVMAFSPDGDFPIVNGEKGVIQGTMSFYGGDVRTDVAVHTLLVIKSEKQYGFICESLTAKFFSQKPDELVSLLQGADQVTISGKEVTALYRGEKTLSRNPHKGKNAFYKFANDFIGVEGLNENSSKFTRLTESFLLDDVFGKKIGLFLEDPKMGLSTFGIPFVAYDGNTFEIAFDYRFPKGQTFHSALETLETFSSRNRLSLSIEKTKEHLYVDPGSELIGVLKKAYEEVTGENAHCLTKGGISYARALENGVAFGPTFEGDCPNTHKPNECIRIETFYKAIIIYCEALRLLAS
ncbi:M20 family peptidase [Neobacillus notoginsengisoli]|uniref:M20 family peptidase n=1 Tax=Neobacillus notoginsengisoli TaxID=1578198 RepID=A0A417YYJ4_9BACI|nr:Sapep family Mn(2+)-dependent dipeptidase [Neobacillus notoginsengisoli]RHW42838.1 M20 family peptidase [Neobacillus notoginsengisoli]